MKTRHTLALASLCLLSTSVSAQTSVGGPIFSDTTWTAAGSPYELGSPVIVAAGATLTIEAGVEVHFVTGSILLVGEPSLGAGTLVARGSRAAPIRFTRPGGPAGAWDTILFSDNAVDAQYDTQNVYTSGSILEHCVIEFAGAASYDGALTLLHSSPRIVSCTFQDNAQRGVYASMQAGAGGLTPSLRLIDCDFRRNSDGGLRLRDGSGHEIQSCQFTDNLASNGAGVSATSSASTRFANCGFTNNQASSVGAGFYATGCASLTIEDSQFTDGVSSSHGGGIYLTSCSNALLLGNVLDANEANTVSGAYENSCSSARIEAGSIRNGSTTSGEGSLSLHSCSQATIAGVEIRDNQTNGSGGGVYVFGGSTQFESCLITRNHTNADGGGLYIRGSSTLTDCIVTENEANQHGGGIHARSQLELQGCTIACNTAGAGGGGLYIDAVACVLDGDASMPRFSIFQGNSAPQGDAIFHDRPYSPSGSGNTSASYVCWGAGNPNTEANRVWDFFDDPSLGILIASNFASCELLECGCQGTPYCATSANSVGAGALMDYSGSTSVLANDFVLRATGSTASQPGLFFYGAGQTQVPFGDGLRCVSGTLIRLSPRNSDALGDVMQAIDFASLPANGQVVPGALWNFQWWYRDPQAGGSGFNLSNGLQVLFCQ